jgi:uncharacterized protein
MCAMSLSAGPLSDGEYDALTDLLGARGALDIEAVLGLLNAVAVAPGLVPASTWVPHVLPPERCAGLGESDLLTVVGALLRLYNEISAALADDAVFGPDIEDIDDRVSFAAGYAAGAALDPVWRSNADHWTFASPLAYLGERHDLVPAGQLESLNAEPGARERVHRDMLGILRAARDVFAKYRQAADAVPAPAPRAGRVGRNDPCPCGSGRKHKRCCAGAARSRAPR